MKLIYHAGSGTYFSAEDGVYVIDSDDLMNDPELSIANLIENGQARSLVLTDLEWRNCIAYSPRAMREEIDEMLEFSGTDDDRHALEWAMNVATDEQLNSVATYILDNDQMWIDYRVNIIDGVREGYRWYQADIISTTTGKGK